MAHNQGLVDMSGAEVEYWGHVGKRFNFLGFRDGAIVPKDEFTANRFAKFNEKGRRFLAPDDFDMVLFMGARVDVSPRMTSLLRLGAMGRSVSTGLKRRVAHDFLQSQMCYGFAKGFAAAGSARIVMAPVSFSTENPAADTSDPVRSCTAEDRAEVWSYFVDAAAQDGITFLPQPDETVTAGVFTKADYAVDRYQERNDYCHRNPAYGALILAQTMALLRA
jgi:hypothetical protein